MKAVFFPNHTHEKHCKEAGCKHPALYRVPGHGTLQGWCKLCRELAFKEKD